MIEKQINPALDNNAHVSRHMNMFTMMSPSVYVCVCLFV